MPADPDNPWLQPVNIGDAAPELATALHDYAESLRMAADELDRLADNFYFLAATKLIAGINEVSGRILFSVNKLLNNRMSSAEKFKFNFDTGTERN